MKENKNNRNDRYHCLYTTISCVNVFLFCFSVISLLSRETNYEFPSQRLDSEPIVPLEAKPSHLDAKILMPCLDPVWCSIPLLKMSYFKFDPPTDPVRWRIAQIQASKGEKVLLQKVLQQFPNHFDFIDGDITFRKLHYVFDVFVDEKRDLSPLFPLSDSATLSESSIEKVERKLLNCNSLNFSHVGRKLSDEMITAPKLVKGVLMYPWELVGKKVIPDPYDFRYANRAPVVSIGYTAYSRDSQTYFAGNRVGGAFIDRKQFFEKWRAAKDK